ncbi:MAG TPA: hypothetical protein VEQ59_14715 [Polyangiaceae bacterium]|nr:hypothetical protein [Polyangiaceae bacterium]
MSNGGVGNTGSGSAGTSTGTGGTPATAGTGSGTGGVVSMGGGGPDVDPGGKKNASPGDKTTMPQDYLRIGEIRLLNNNWGSAALGCNTPMSVFINTDNSFGWDFDRGDCDKAASNSQPDFPQIEFGVHPFGKGSDLATSPDYSSTTLLPIQIKNLTSASMTIDGLNVSLQAESSWDITFEFWLSQRDPATADSGVYSELMTFWGWQNGRWPDAPNGTGPKGPGAGDQVTAGNKTYKLWVQDDNWSGGKWRYFQFRANDGPQKGFSGTLDIKPLVDYLVNTKKYSTDYYITRFEVGTEIDDNTKGSVNLKGITFEVNGQKRSQVFTPK